MIRKHAQGTTVDVYIQPRASTTELAGKHDGALKVRVAAPPVDGAANAELVSFFSKLFKVPKRDVSIANGEKGRRKTILIRTVEPATIESAIDD